MMGTSPVSCVPCRIERTRVWVVTLCEDFLVKQQSALALRCSAGRMQCLLELFFFFGRKLFCPFSPFADPVSPHLCKVCIVHCLIQLYCFLKHIWQRLTEAARVACFQQPRQTRLQNAVRPTLAQMTTARLQLWTQLTNPQPEPRWVYCGEADSSQEHKQQMVWP